MKNFKEAYKYQALYIELFEKIFTGRKNKDIANIQARYDFEKKEKENQLLKKEQELQRLILERTRLTTIAVSVVAVLMLILLLVVYNRYRYKQKANQ